MVRTPDLKSSSVTMPCTVILPSLRAYPVVQRFAPCWGSGRFGSLMNELVVMLTIADSGFAALGVVSSCPATGVDLTDAAVMCPELLQRFATVSDGRRDQGRVRPVAVVLALCAAAVVAGMSPFTAIAGWAADVPAELLAQLYGRPLAGLAAAYRETSHITSSAHSHR
jgi:hypothetical protein